MLLRLPSFPWPMLVVTSPLRPLRRRRSPRVLSRPPQLPHRSQPLRSRRLRARSSSLA